MMPADLATISLLDTDQGVCPEGHVCRPNEVPAYRSRSSCGYRGPALICWDITVEEIDSAERAGAAPAAIEWARTMLFERGYEPRVDRHVRLRLGYPGETNRSEISRG
jgi:hypothetical protein